MKMGEDEYQLWQRSTTASETAIFPTNFTFAFPQEEMSMRTTNELLPG